MSQHNPLEELYRRPGFMIRRVHQIAVALFIEETGKLGVTNRQYGILFVLNHRPGVDQISLANLLGLDRSTTGMVLKKLEQDGLVVRSIGAHDRRRHSLRLTTAGEKLLSELAAPARKAKNRVLSAFTARERKLFLALLEKFTRAFNGSTRVPLDPHRSSETALRRIPRPNAIDMQNVGEDSRLRRSVARVERKRKRERPRDVNRGSASAAPSRRPKAQSPNSA